MLDSGNSANFTGDKNNRNYGRPMASQRWLTLTVSNAEFVKTMPCSAMQLNTTEMLIYGGEKTTTFTFDTRDV